MVPGMLEITDPSSDSDNREFIADFSFTNLFEKFNILAVHDSSKNVIATVFQQLESISTP